MYPGDDGVDFAIGEFGQAIGHTYKARGVGHVAYDITLVDVYFNVVITFQDDTTAAGIAAGSVAGVTIILQDRYDAC